MRISKNKSVRKPRLYRKRKPTLTKRFRAAVKTVIKKQIETKLINVPDSASMGLTNTKNRLYTALSGLQYLCSDIFRQFQGVGDGSTNSSANRVGDKVQAVGFEMNYMFHSRNNYTIGSAQYLIPFIKLRIIVFRTSPLVAALSQGQLCDVGYLPTDTSVLQPIDWDEGYVKEVLYDKVHIIRNPSQVATTSSSNPNAPYPYANVFHFKKYIKYDHPIKYLDSNVTSPNSTDKPINVAILAEVDDSNTGLVPSGTSLIYTTGYTRAWFKDA